METQALVAEVRAGRGKGPARQLRASGRIPAVFYGRGVEPRALSVVPRDVLKVLSTVLGRNVLIALKVDGKDEYVMLKDMQVDPISREPKHVDLYRVDLERPVTARVPFKTTGRAAGVVKGGKLKVVYRDLPVLAKPGQIPASISADVSHLELHQAVQVKDLVLPEGVVCTLAPTRSVATVEIEKKIEEEPAPGAAAAAAPGAAPAAGASTPPPAAAGKAAAPAKGGKK